LRQGPFFFALSPPAPCREPRAVSARPPRPSSIFQAISVAAPAARRPVCLLPVRGARLARRARWTRRLRLTLSGLNSCPTAFAGCFSSQASLRILIQALCGLPVFRLNLPLRQFVRSRSSRILRSGCPVLFHRSVRTFLRQIRKFLSPVRPRRSPCPRASAWRQMFLRLPPGRLRRLPSFPEAGPVLGLPKDFFPCLLRDPGHSPSCRFFRVRPPARPKRPARTRGARPGPRKARAGLKGRPPRVPVSSLPVRVLPVRRGTAAAGAVPRCPPLRSGGGRRGAPAPHFPVRPCPAGAGPSPSNRSGPARLAPRRRPSAPCSVPE
jgi:hypothetical protein